MKATKTRYGAVFLAVAGIYTPGPIWLSFGIANAGLDQMRAVAAGILVGTGTLGSIGKFKSCSEDLLHAQEKKCG